MSLCRLRCPAPILIVCLCSSALALRAQDLLVAALPDAPSALQSTSPAQKSKVAATATVRGSITDIGGTVVSGAQVVLLPGEDAAPLKTTTAEDGSFVFTSVPSGEFTLTAIAEGLTTATVTGTASADKVDTLPTLALRIAAVNTDIDVTMTHDELALQDVHDAEQQRVLGVIPNFYVTYNRNALSLTAKQKFNLAFHVALDPVTVVRSAIGAGISQAAGTFSGFGDDGGAYADRFGAFYANSISNTLFRHAIYPALFRQDPRYFYQGTGTTASRVRHAIGSAVICRGDNGKRQFNASNILGAVTTGALSTLYFPRTTSRPVLIGENAGLAIVGLSIGDLLQEFVWAHVTSHSKRSGAPRP